MSRSGEGRHVPLLHGPACDGFRHEGEFRERILFTKAARLSNPPTPGPPPALGPPGPGAASPCTSYIPCTWAACREPGAACSRRTWCPAPASRCNRSAGTPGKTPAGGGDSSSTPNSRGYWLACGTAQDGHAPQIARKGTEGTLSQIPGSFRAKTIIPHLANGLPRRQRSQGPRPGVSVAPYQPYPLSLGRSTNPRRAFLHL